MHIERITYDVTACRVDISVKFGGRVTKVALTCRCVRSAVPRSCAWCALAGAAGQRAAGRRRAPRPSSTLLCKGFATCARAGLRQRRLRERTTGRCGGGCTPATTAPTTSPTGWSAAGMSTQRARGAAAATRATGASRCLEGRPDADGRLGRLVERQPRRLRRAGHRREHDRGLRGPLRRRLRLAQDRAGPAAGWPTGFIHLERRDAYVATALPAISGTAQVDKPLSVTTGSLEPAPGDLLAYQWLANDVPIPGATGRRRTPRPPDQVGVRLSVRVSGVQVRLPRPAPASSAATARRRRPGR